MNDMKLFYLYRKEDESGISGTGFVAEGVVFENGKCVLAWLTEYTSVAVYDDIETLREIHGHRGKTIVVWEDHDFIDEKGNLILNAFTGCVDANTGVWIGSYTDAMKGFNEKDKKRISVFLKELKEKFEI